MLPRRKVVLIEDNEQSRYLATYLLEHHGFEVAAAEEGRAGLALLSQGLADLVLLDLQLPDIDGFEVVRKLKADPRTAHLPVVAVSAFAMAGDRASALAAGCDGYIEKPIDPDLFLDQIKPFFRSE